MKTSELIKILRKNGCVFIEHGKEHDKWYSDRTGKTSVFPGMEAKKFLPEQQIGY